MIKKKVNFDKPPASLKGKRGKNIGLKGKGAN